MMTVVIKKDNRLMGSRSRKLNRKNNKEKDFNST